MILRLSKLRNIMWRYRRTVLLTVAIVIMALVALRYWPRPPLREAFPSSIAVYDARGKLLRLTLARDEQYREWLPLAQMPPDLVEAVQLHEDQHFRWHPGVNPVAILRAAHETYTGSARIGGSTITMQLARRLYRLNTRSPLGKLKQMALALWLEARYSKSDILEAYLNSVPYGGNVEGVGAASLIYFGKAPKMLSLAETLSIAVIPQSPARRTPDAQTPQSALTTARMRLFERWVPHHPQHAEQRSLVAAPLSLRGKGQLPFAAPHYTTMLLAGARANETEIHGTLDLQVQRLVERQINLYRPRIRRMGITNASALLVDWTTMQAKAWVGSVDFHDDDIDGQVNGVLAKRSPGSTLKPFVYALALDQGLIHPMTVLKDAPQSFGPFTPENFDSSFAGPITAQAALVYSRNIPAVALSAQLSKPTLYEFLRDAGVARMASERHYGLALTLGGGEVTMEELARLYTILPNRGVLRPLTTRLDATSEANGPAMLSPEASFITIDMLEHNPRRDVAYAGRIGRLPIAWKTGTSWGFRDAWTAGVFGRYVLVVWLGNFDGAGNQALVGVDSAAPLFFGIADALAATDPSIVVARRQPANVARIEVCQASGDLPNADCPRTTQTWFIPGKSPIHLSTLHRAVMIDTRNGRATCPPYDARYTRREVFEYWPSDLARLFAQAGMPRRQPPSEPDCGDKRDSEATAPQIASPLRGVAYQLRGDTDDERNSLTLRAIADGSVRTLYWFAGTNYLGSSAAGHEFIWKSPPPGRHRLRVIDDHGASDARDVVVELARR